MVKKQRATDSLVTFLNSQGSNARGTLMDLTRHAVVFEVYNPYSIVQLSEVLQDLRINRGGRDIYQGRAVVTNLVNTGLMLIVTASLVEPWSDMVHLKPGPQLRDEVSSFVEDWEQSNCTLEPGYMISVNNFRNFLLELSRWLKHGEAVAQVTEPDMPADLVLEFVQDVDAMTSSRFAELYGRFEEAAAEVPKKHLAVHRSFAQREMHPVMLTSPFIHRSFVKPLGYAGDYTMVRMMLSDGFEGNSTFAKVLNKSALQADAPRAHRNRIEMLKEILASESRRAGERQQPFRVLNVGCGPAEEVRQFMESSWLSDNCEFELVDFNAETLQYAESTLLATKNSFKRETNLRFTLRSVNDLIKEATGQAGYESQAFDLVYCAGLFDYFGDSVCAGLVELFYECVRPDGLVVTTNVTPGHSSVQFMSHVMEWNLRLRDEPHMMQLAPPAAVGSGAVARTQCDSTGVNVFLSIRKPGSQATE